MSIEYRRMTEADVQAAAALEAECFSEPWSEAAFAESIPDKNIVYVVAIRDGELIGNCGVRCVCGEGEITNVAIHQDMRKQGIATAMMEELIRQGELLGTCDFTLEVRCQNAGAIALYEKLGFVSEGIRPRFYTNPPDDAMIMWRRGPRG